MVIGMHLMTGLQRQTPTSNQHPNHYVRLNRNEFKYRRY
jgi:hypothetical protein